MPPKIRPEFSSLSKKFDTPYFGVLGCINVDASKKTYNSNVQEIHYDVNKKKSYVYFIVVDVESGEIIFSLTRLNKYLYNDKTIHPSMHDIFYILKDVANQNI